MNEVRHFGRNLVGRDFAVGDIHGHVSAMLVQLEALGFDRARDRLFSVGDLVDRGPECDRVDELLAQPWFFAIQGNHEDMAIRWPNGHMNPDTYIANGGGWNVMNPPAECQRVADMLSALPVAMEVETSQGLIGLVHADVPGADWPFFKVRLEHPEASRNMLSGIREMAMWDRTRIQNDDRSLVKGVRAVIVGHTPVDRMVVLGNVHHIDTKGWIPQRGGRFTFLNLETLVPWMAPRPELVWEG